MVTPATSITALSLMQPVRVTQLSGRKSRQIDLQPDAAQRAAIAAMLGLDALRKMRFTATLRPLGNADWELSGRLGATVVQPCAVTLEPVTTRIEEPVSRRFLADMPEPTALEVEMPEDDSQEPLGTEIDISAIALEALSLAVPAFVRGDSAAAQAEVALESAPPGAAPIDLQTRRPFAALEGLKKALEEKDKPSDSDRD